MTIRTLVESLQAMPRDMLQTDGKQLAAERIVFPADWKKTEVGILEDEGSHRNPSGRLLWISASFGMTSVDVNEKLVSFLEQIRLTQLTGGHFVLKIQVHWPAEKFLDEQSVSSMIDINMGSRFWSCDPTKMRILKKWRRCHELEASLWNKQFRLEARGDFSQVLPVIIDEVHPRWATLRLSPADAQCWLSQTKGLRRWRLKRQLKWNQERMQVPDCDYIKSEEHEWVEATVAVDDLKHCSDAIGKPIINDVTDQQSYVERLAGKVRYRSQILPITQKLIQSLREFQAPTVFGEPMLTLDQARVLLDKEIDLVTKSYEIPFFLGLNTRTTRGPLLERLIVDHFGEEITELFQVMDPQQYLAFLQEKGFQYVSEEEADDPFTRLENQFPVILKEKYLLAFLRQSYNRDPHDSIKIYQRCYVNNPPLIWITASTRSINPSRLICLTLPSLAYLSQIELKDWTDAYGDCLSINFPARYPDEDEVFFRLQVALGSGRLIDIQEEICQRLGVVVH